MRILITTTDENFDHHRDAFGFGVHACFRGNDGLHGREHGQDHHHDDGHAGGSR